MAVDSTLADTQSGSARVMAFVANKCMSDLHGVTEVAASLHARVTSWARESLYSRKEGKTDIF